MIRSLAASALTAAVLLAQPAAAGHGAPPSPRPLHERLALTERAAIARVEVSEPGRLSLHTERALLGELPERFEVKRSPSRPPPLAVGDRALLLLRGARSPYLLVDEPHEMIRLADESMAVRWATAVNRLAALRDTPQRWPELYVGWIDEGPETLRELAAIGLADPGAPFQPLPPEVLLERAGAALDPTRSFAARRASLLFAIRSPDATSWLLERVPMGDSADDAAISLTVLEAGAAHQSPGQEAALRRALADPRAEMRRGALALLQHRGAALSPVRAK